jgi:CheY-like chemotaxis protein
MTNAALKDNEPAAFAPAAGAADPARRGRVLIVEDNALNRMVATTLLKKMGVDVETAETGGIAVHMVSQNAYDLILMDVQMPGMDGLTATRLIRSRAGHGNQPVVVAFAANSEQSDRMAAKLAGLDDFVTKPINRKGLMDLLDRWKVPRDGGAAAPAA